MDKRTFFALIDKYLNGSASHKERELLKEYYKRLEKSGESDPAKDDKAFLKEKIFQEVIAGITPDRPRAIRFRRSVWFAIAASLVIVVLPAGYFFLSGKKDRRNNIMVQKKELSVPKDILPGRHAVVLTTSDGSRIDLDSATGLVSKTNGINVINSNGVLAYKTGAAASNKDDIFHTISTARGNQYQVLLSDSSKVWLNAVSSLRFPVSFKNSGVREVQLTGEGYFEVAKNLKKPFRVSVNGMLVEVLGTHFNVNAYYDEAGVATTLIEGRVRIGDLTLKPGQQAMGSNNKIAIRNDIDIRQVMAWQRGIFEFNQTDLATIMRQISRWYDVDVRYASVPSNVKFGGSISRSLPLSNMLRLLEANGIKFKLEDRILTVQ